MNTPTLKYLFGDTSPLFYDVADAQALDIGDMLGILSGALVRAEDFTWGTAVATPTAPTVADGGVAVGTPLTNDATGVKIAYQFPWGEGALSSAGSATPTAGALLKVSGSPLIPATDALWTNIYVETAAGSGTYKLWGTTLGSAVYVDSYGAGAIPAAGNYSAAAVLTDATTITQYNFAKAFAGISGQYKAADATRITGNIAGKVRVDTRGVFSAPIASTTLTFGDWVAPVKASGNTLVSQTVSKVASAADPLGKYLGIGRVVVSGTSLTTATFALTPSLGLVF